MQAQTGVRIDAIVGLDALAPNNFQIDYESQKLKFGSFRIASPVPMIESAPLAIITTRLNGTAVNLAVDTGSSELVLFRDALPDSVGTLPTARTVQLSNVAGDVVAPIVRLQNFTVGDNQVSGQLAVLATVPQCCEFGGILGVSGLHIRKLSFDFQDRLVGIELFDDESAASTSDGHCRPAFPGASCRNALLPPSNR
jgi:Aspartyl protease